MLSKLCFVPPLSSQGERVRRIIWDTTNTRNYPALLLGVTQRGALLGARIDSCSSAPTSQTGGRGALGRKNDFDPVLRKPGEPVQQVVDLRIKFVFALLLVGRAGGPNTLSTPRITETPFAVEIGQFLLKSTGAMFWQARQTVFLGADYEFPPELSVAKQLDFVADAEGAELLCTTAGGRVIRSASIRDGSFSGHEYFSLDGEGGSGFGGWRAESATSDRILAFDVLDNYLGVLLDNRSFAVFESGNDFSRAGASTPSFKLVFQGKLAVISRRNKTEKKQEDVLRPWNAQGAVNTLGSGLFAGGLSKSILPTATVAGGPGDRSGAGEDPLGNRLTVGVFEFRRGNNDALIALCYGSISGETDWNFAGPSVLARERNCVTGEEWHVSSVSSSRGGCVESVDFGPLDASAMLTMESSPLICSSRAPTLKVCPLPADARRAALPLNLYHPNSLHFLLTRPQFFSTTFLRAVLGALLEGLRNGCWAVVVEEDDPGRGRANSEKVESVAVDVLSTSHSPQELSSSSDSWRLQHEEHEEMINLLRERSVPCVDPLEQVVLSNILGFEDPLTTEHSTVQQVDDAARRYLRSWGLFRAYTSCRVEDDDPSKTSFFAASMSSEDLCWALHSVDQSALFDLVNRANAEFAASTPPQERGRQKQAGGAADVFNDKSRRSAAEIWSHFEHGSGFGFWVGAQSLIKRCCEELPKRIIQSQKDMLLAERNPEDVALWYNSGQGAKFSPGFLIRHRLLRNDFSPAIAIFLRQLSGSEIGTL